MLFLMFVSLYTSRITLQALGVNDFGIYTAVGGLVTMFSIISGSLSAAISRFITYELGIGNKDNLKTIFSSALTIQIVLSLIIVFFAETIGLWFLNVKMNIPIERMDAANWVFQISIITFAIGLISIPYNAMVISYEKMTFFTYISIFEVMSKLLIAYLIVNAPLDKLMLYSFLIGLTVLISNFIYVIYCRHSLEGCTYRFIWDKCLLKQMFNFAGWNFIGASSVVLRDQGGNIIINLFCGPAVNAARAIAFQVNGAIMGFVTNFMTALNPQITKSYAAGEHRYMMSLIFQGARFSFYLLLLLSLPVLINTHYILHLWLNIVPDHTISFVRLTLIFAMCESISNPLITVMLATGRIKEYQIVVGGLQMLNLPVSYMLLRIGLCPESVLITSIVISQFCLFARLLMLREMIGISISDFIKNVYFNSLFVCSIAMVFLLIFSQFLEESFFKFLLISFISFVATSFSIFFAGCSSKERKFFIEKIRSFVFVR